MRIKLIHRFSAVILGLFILSHLAVHLIAVNGSSAHLQTLEIVQMAYRPFLLEYLLVIAVGIQIFTGARRLRFKGIDGWARAQVISGCYLIVFFIFHTSAALYTHHIVGIETDFYWAAGSLQYSPIKIGFAVYYFAAVLAVFVHWASAVHFGWTTAPGNLKWALPIIGSIIATTIVATFSGAFYPIKIPAETAAYYESNFGWLGVKP